MNLMKSVNKNLPLVFILVCMGVLLYLLGSILNLGFLFAIIFVVVVNFIIYNLYKDSEFINNSQSWLLLILGFLMVLVKLILTGAQSPYLILNAGHDDGLFYNLSESLSTNQWLGNYGQLTLAKGMFFPLWMSISNAASVPILVANQMLYIASCIFVVFSLSPKIKSQYLSLVIFGVLIFNPVSNEITRLHRDAIYPAVCMFLFAGCIGMFLRRDCLKKMIGYALAAGISFLAAWNTREDSFWLIPFVAAAIIITMLFILFERKNSVLKKRIRYSAYTMIPVIVLHLGNTMVAWTNYNHYGRFVVNDYMSKDFQGAYGSLTRVRHENWIADIPVPYDVRQKIYEVSPAFRELKESLESNHSKMMQQIKDDYNDYRGGWFFWSLRMAVSECGYYETPKKAGEYYERLAKEVNAACDSGLLDAVTGKRATLSSPFRKEYISPLLQQSVEATLYTIKYEQINPGIDGQLDGDRNTDDALSYLRSSPGKTQQSVADQNKEGLFHSITAIYQHLNPVLTVIGIVSFILLLIMFLFLRLTKKKVFYLEELIIAASFGLLFILRIVMIAFVQVSSFGAVNSLYLSSAYPIVLLFNMTSILFCYNVFKKFLLSKENA